MVDKALELTADIVASFVGRNSVAPDALPELISSIYAALAQPEGPATAPAPAATRAPTASEIRKSITPDALISFEDGRPYRMLRRHLSALGLTPEQYRAKWSLPDSYPMTAPSYSAARSALAKSIGLGQAARAGKGRA